MALLQGADNSHNGSENRDQPENNQERDADQDDREYPRNPNQNGHDEMENHCLQRQSLDFALIGQKVYDQRKQNGSKPCAGVNHDFDPFVVQTIHSLEKIIHLYYMECIPIST